MDEGHVAGDQVGGLRPEIQKEWKRSRKVLAESNTSLEKKTFFLSMVT